MRVAARHTLAMGGTMGLSKKRDFRSNNRLKLGLFGLNCSGGLTMTKAPERWDPSWDNNLAAAQLADEAGLEFLLPIARWQGYRGETDTEGTSFETLTWAAGLLAATRSLTVFGTVHIALVNPAFAAKQIVTADHVGKGRFGLNIVSGWNEGEFDMFGVELREHDQRYAVSDEWVTVVKRIWSETEPFDFDGRFFRMKGVLGKPKPYGDSNPLLMSAGSSPAGRSFALQHVDCLFMGVHDLSILAEETRKVRATAPSPDFPLYTSCHIMCRRTEREAKEFYNYIVHENGDWEAAEYIVAIRARHARSAPPELVLQMKERHVSGIGTLPIIGSFDQVADTMRQMSEAGLNGLAIGLVNYRTEFPFLRDEILPRLRRMGLREADDPSARAIEERP
jgi:FMNH2-dependent dimethyl sulfone monooxygenase